MENIEVNSQTIQPEAENPQSVVEVENAEQQSEATPVEAPVVEPAAAGPAVAQTDAPAQEMEAAETPVVENLEEVREEAKNKRAGLSAQDEAELSDSLGGVDLDAALMGTAPVSVTLEVNAKIKVKVVSVSKDNVFVEIPGSAQQGIVALKQFSENPETGAELEVVVTRTTNDDGLFEAGLPGTAVAAVDWSIVQKGMTVETTVTGHNSGGLECKVGNLRGFIPISQIASHRVENLEEFLGQKLECLVTEVNPKRNNLVLSRRKILDRERDAMKNELFAQLAPGQIYDGVVRTIMDFGAFVDIGGIDGLLHISQLSWSPVKHPSDVLSVGQEIRVQVEKIDREKKKISFAYRSMTKNPWEGVEERFPVDSEVSGKVSKIMNFGAFVELEPGIEGLVHISAISHKRVGQVEDVLKVGEEVRVKVLSVDPKARRISLSIKALTEAPVSEKRERKDKSDEREEIQPANRVKSVRKELKGGVGDSGFGRFG